MAARRLILASASPRRRTLLADAGVAFEVWPADLDEISYHAPGIVPGDLAQKLAVAKAQAIAARFPDCAVLAADTIVALGSAILGKPDDADHARRMLTDLSGSTHQVITGVAVMCAAASHLDSRRVSTTVQMRPLSPGQIDRYVATNAWQGKAGGYGLQDDDPFVHCIRGCATNVVGLPMTTTLQMLAALPPLP